MSQITRCFHNISKNIRVQSMFPPIIYKLCEDVKALKTSARIVPKLAVCYSHEDYILSNNWEMIDSAASMVEINVSPIALPRNNLDLCRRILFDLNSGSSYYLIIDCEILCMMSNV